MSSTTTTEPTVPTTESTTTTTESADTTPTTESKKITLKTADGELFEVDEAVAMEFAAVKAFFDDNVTTAANSNNTNDNVVPLPNVLSGPLSAVITYCKQWVELRKKSATENEKKDFNMKFVAEKTNEDLKEMILVSNYLNIKDLLEVLNQAVADRIKNKSVEYVRAFFGIENDFTPEEEARLREENAWAFEGVDQD